MRIGLVPPDGFWVGSIDERRNQLQRMVDVGIDHVFMADHVSFRDGSGTDGIVEIAALSQLHPTIGVMTGIYLLPLRHPLPVARQLATMHKIAPQRMIFGVGIGGEDRHEVEVCGVDPATRGKRMNESLAIVRALMRGEEVTMNGDFFQLERARIKPSIEPAIPIIVGGRSNAALARTAQLGDGWLGAWCSVKRFREAVALIAEQAVAEGRLGVRWQHGYQPWVGVADTKEEARARLQPAMEKFYKVPFEKFERYTPYGTPDQVAAALAPYVEAGCSLMNLKVVAGNDAETVAAAGSIARSLTATHASLPEPAPAVRE